MQKIIIVGFPHCGTSILKSIIGHIDDVEEIIHERRTVNVKTNKKFALCKWPFVWDEFFGLKYKDYIKIFIVRNPAFVFSSLNKRFDYNIPDDHSFDIYINTIKNFIKFNETPHNNIYTIRYEDLFDNNYYHLRQLLDSIGMTYDDSIFDNSKHTNAILPKFKIPEEVPKNQDHTNYRTWQINQPFVSNNDVSKIDLTTEQKQLILNNEYVKILYPDIHTII